jgi:hypothetical protein
LPANKLKALTKSSTMQSSLQGYYSHKTTHTFEYDWNHKILFSGQKLMHSHDHGWFHKILFSGKKKTRKHPLPCHQCFSCSWRTKQQDTSHMLHTCNASDRSIKATDKSTKPLDTS